MAARIAASSRPAPSTVTRLASRSTSADETPGTCPTSTPIAARIRVVVEARREALPVMPLVARRLARVALSGPANAGAQVNRAEEVGGVLVEEAPAGALEADDHVTDRVDGKPAAGRE